MATEHPGYERFATEISSLFSARAPPFLYVTDPVSPRTTAVVVNSVLSSMARSDASSRVYHAQINAVACFNARILYDTVLNQLAGWQVEWDTACTNWAGDNEERWNENLDGFIHGLKTVHSFIGRENTAGSTKGKGKQIESDLVTDIRQIVLVIERAERLPDQMPDLLVPLTRLAELTRLDLSIVFVSDVPWEDIRPPFGASPDPYYVDVLALNKEDLLRRLGSTFHAVSSQSEHTNGADSYHPSLRPLYSQFLSVLVDSCSYVQDPNELQYIAAARWPGFVKPILDAHNDRVDEDVDMDGPDEPGLKPPSEHVRMRLIRIFKPSFKTALETLYPRLEHATSWAALNGPEENLLAKPANKTQPIPDPGEVEVDDGRIADLPRMSKFILVAAYLASTNPHTSDVRMFGRGVDEKKRKRRSHKPSAKSGTTKAPQRVLGPNTFPLDRLIAILGALLEENDVDQRLPAPEYLIPGEHTDMEIARVGIYNTIIELSDIGLFHRTSAAEKLDGPPTFKCGISYKMTSALAQQLDIPLNDLLWDPA
ncbi:origin recognition complex subunit 5 C-terminus-domain-containing protein [Mycena alexandri]|uniref:Origin recognition complex subunit 5 C-terminus-domain-containing protein n=1 Tax=Mycena alexandri TaxID=1745969 RepID=A0AAD6SFJ6_9AGAR|nr:origin recognition complex subunit 5 C-terminus-domain-containing protein [Mycena alexandri]